MNQAYKYRFSVWTATYNRAGFLPRLYESLLAQTFKDFEWIIVDDGSIDDTETVCRRFIDEGRLNIRYIKKENGGKHTAWVAATALFEGRYVVTIDSDDMLTADALDIFNKHWADLEHGNDYDLFWEVRGLCRTEDGKIIGATKPLPAPVFDTTHIDMYFKHKYLYEMHGCRKVEVLRNEAKVPEAFEYSNLCSNYGERLRWIAAGRKYKTRYINNVVRVYMYDSPGTLSLQRNFGKNVSVKRTYNSLITAKYSIERDRDLWVRFNYKGHVVNILMFSYMSMRVGINPIKTLKTSALTDKAMLIISYIPLRLLLLFLH